jgi:hypothetical protein
MPRLLHGAAKIDEPDELTFQQIGSSSAMGLAPLDDPVYRG